MGKEKNVGGGKCLFSSYILHIPSLKNSNPSLSSAELDRGPLLCRNRWRPETIELLADGGITYDLPGGLLFAEG
ncbi:unnamed protein product [Linum tenue]|uniref:Uncharacterized protein n=1 Tax=Linum tenue TaxID=586396 RepID=A0AAV0QV95_9ROSI|nr:unnamed protein product [Linum tenue]